MRLAGVGSIQRRGLQNDLGNRGNWVRMDDFVLEWVHVLARISAPIGEQGDAPSWSWDQGISTRRRLSGLAPSFGIGSRRQQAFASVDQ